MQYFALFVFFAAAANAFPAVNNKEVKTEEKPMKPQQLEQLASLIATAQSYQENQIKEQLLSAIVKALEVNPTGRQGPIPVDPPLDVEPAPDAPGAPEGGDDLSNVFTDLVNTVSTINGLNSVDLNNQDIISSLFGIGNVDIVDGGAGTTTDIRLGDLVNTIGAIQGQWYNFDIANVHVQVRDN